MYTNQVKNLFNRYKKRIELIKRENQEYSYKYQLSSIPRVWLVYFFSKKQTEISMLIFHLFLLLMTSILQSSNLNSVLLYLVLLDLRSCFRPSPLLPHLLPKFNLEVKSAADKILSKQSSSTHG